MSVVKETFIICDVCFKNFGVDNRSRNAQEQRDAAKEEDWMYSGNKDYCPDCRAKNKDGQYHKRFTKK